ncbi:MAG: nitroreductase family deazaflavin-dependent oxidoreductase, partial [Myxococcales bacterium]|nr:nitroreductase family deazaflavin-dependent oxidoreductase [Myxococcales bacterium]
MPYDLVMSWVDWVTRIHREVYRSTGGRVGARLNGLDMVLLTTTGRKSGQPRTLPLACLRDGEDWIVVASNGGQDFHPAWWLNLQENPRAQAQLGRETRSIVAHEAIDDDRSRLWPLLKQQNPAYPKYEKKTDR